MLTREVVHIEDLPAVAEREFPLRAADYRTSGARTVVSVPMLRDGEAVGALTTRRMERRPFTDQEIARLQSFADQAVIAIENARLFEELQDRVGELQALGEVGQAVSSSLDLTEVLTTIVGNATRLAGADAGIVYEYDEAEGIFEVRAADQMADDLATSLRAARFRLGEGAVGR